MASRNYSRQAVQKYKHRKTSVNRPSSNNPGIHRRLGIMDTKDNYDMEEIEELDELESDFMQTSSLYSRIKDEEKWAKDKLEYRIVKQKYFKEPQVNFLTWMEKQTIRELNDKDPVENSPEILADMFPADPEVIARIIKGNWYPQNGKRIQKHDIKAAENWMKYKAGEFDDVLSPLLKKHLSKFQDRDYSSLLDDTKKISTSYSRKIKLPVPRKSEFVDIINSCPSESIANNSQRLIADKSMDEFDKLTKLQQKFEKFKQSHQKINSEVVASDGYNNYVEETRVMGQQGGSKKSDLTIPPIKAFIRIPKEVQKEGATYKYKDCYYDDDGEFLYRVPGIK